jgi:hypothetical protein
VYCQNTREAIMSDLVQSDEFAKYAPRWLREGTAKPSNTTTLPARSIAAVGSDESRWTLPSTFQGDIRAWRAPGTELEVAARPPVFASAIGDRDLVRRLIWTAAITSVAVSAMAVLGVVLFPSAPKDTAPISKLALSDTQRIKNAPAKPSELKPAVETSTSFPQVTNAKSAAPPPAELSTSQAQLQQQQADPQPLTQVQQTQTKQPMLQSALAQQQTSLPPVADADEIGRLISRGEAFFAQGDVVAARVLLERAAEGRDARAALALGASYDPNVLKNMGAFGIKPDPELAHIWYERAASFGSDEANKRLTALAQLAQ